MSDSVVVVESPLTSHDQLPALVWYLVLNIWTRLLVLFWQVQGRTSALLFGG